MLRVFLFPQALFFLLFNRRNEIYFNLIYFMDKSLFLISILVLLTYVNTNKDPDIDRSVELIITTKGYSLSSYYVTTPDSYSLKLYRVGSNNGVVAKQPILLMHGLLDSADSWVANSEDKSFAMILANKGYDVWIGNNRGNKHSRYNFKISPKERKFWDFSFHEMGLLDITSMITFIKGVTHYEKVTYIGHSQGGGQFFALCSLEPEFCKNNINGMVGLAPAVFLDHLRSPVMKKILITNIEKELDFFGYDEIFPSKDDINPATKFICSNFKFICNVSLEEISDQVASDVNQERLKVFLSHFPSGTSLKSIVHLKKIIKTKRFIRLDKDEDYPLERVNVPIYVYVGKHDLLVDVVDGKRLYDSLSKEYAKGFYVYANMGHLTFLLTKGQENYVENVMRDIDEINKK